MDFPAFFSCLSKQAPQPRVLVSHLKDIIDLHHTGVGNVSYRYFPDFDGSTPGNFIWLEDERTSPYEEPYNDAVVFINSRYQDNRQMRRIIAAKETMHVFDGKNQKANDSASFTRLVMEIAANPMIIDVSEPYSADMEAFWKAIICMVPPWVRDSYLAEWEAGTIKASELAARLWLPESIVSAAMGNYYEKAKTTFGI